MADRQTSRHTPYLANGIMRSLPLLFFLLTFQAANSFSQNQHKIDSLTSALKNSREDSNKVNLLITLCKQYMNVNPEPMKDYAQQDLDLSQKINFSHGEIKSLNVLGSYYYLTADFKKALDYS